MAKARPLILIPTYNTGPILRETVAGALAQGFPVWVVVDGSTDGSPALLDEFRNDAHPHFRVISLERNQGKGAAVLHALNRAIDAGFTHILTMDSDGQHPASSIPCFLEISARHPEAAVFGRPVFDTCAPALRVNGRKLSNFWANLETLWWGIGDSLFGMRLYPAEKLRDVMKLTPFARRFDFEPEVAVWLSWFRVPMISLPTPVRYPRKEDGGISQFRYLRDNTLLTWMHFRLVLIFFLILPYLLFLRGLNPLRHLKPEAP